MSTVHFAKTKHLKPIKSSEECPIAPWKENYSKFMVFWSVASHSWLLIQAITIFINKDASGVSLPAFILLSISSLIWLFYSLKVLPKRNLPIILSSVVSILFGIVLLVGIIMYK
jgi:uncharacterized protein with PQ loop repeat